MIEVDKRTKTFGGAVAQLRGALSWAGLNPSWEGLVFSPEIRFTRDLGDKRKQVKLRLTPTFARDDTTTAFYGAIMYCFRESTRRASED